MCPIDDKGNKRPGFRFIASYYGTEVNEVGVEDYRDIESDGIEYETTPAVNGIGSSYNFGMDLIQQSIANTE